MLAFRAMLVATFCVFSTVAAGAPPAAFVSPVRLAVAGIRQLDGQHLTLFTDLPSDPDVDSLPALFDQATAQLCAYLGVDPQRAADWRLVGCIMRDPAPFQSVGLIDESTPVFDHGYSLDDRFWMNEQPSPYYRRNLLLHEGVHAFMNMLLGGSGPPWYTEGIAELLASHRVVDDRLELRYYPASRDEVPMWGRIKLVQDNLREGRSYSAAEVLDIIPGADRTTDGYAWAWALAAFLDGHPRYQSRFRQLPALVRDEQFNRRFMELFAKDWRDLELEWRIFINEVDFGYDFSRAAIDPQPLHIEPDGDAATLFIAADRGWQSTRFQIEPNVTYRIGARGQFEVAQDPKPWISEPGGVSIEYYQGRPLGQLLAAVRPDDDSTSDAKSFLQPIPVGLGTRIRSSKRGTLYLRVNESPAGLADNRGQVEVRIAPQ